MIQFRWSKIENPILDPKIREKLQNGYFWQNELVLAKIVYFWHRTFVQLKEINFTANSNTTPFDVDAGSYSELKLWYGV